MGIGRISKKRKSISIICIGVICGVGLAYIKNYNIIEGFAEGVEYSPQSLVKSYSSINQQVKDRSISQNEVEYLNEVDSWNVCNENSNYKLREDENG